MDDNEVQVRLTCHMGPARANHFDLSAILLRFSVDQHVVLAKMKLRHLSLSVGDQTKRLIANNAGVNPGG